MTGDAFAPGLLTRLPVPPRKVVLVRASRIGDFILATPAIRALRAALPGAQFTYVGLPFVRELVERSPHLDQYEVFPGWPGMADQFFEPQRALQFFARMQEEKFDLAIQINGSGVYANPFVLMLGARATAGFIRPGDPPGRLDAAFPFPEAGHEIDRLLALTTFLGAEPQSRETEFPLSAADHSEAENLLGMSHQPLLGLHPGAREATKRWPAARFAAVGATLAKDYGAKVIVVGGLGERELAADVALRLGVSHINLAGRTTLGGLGAVLSRLMLLITNDSGPAHMAQALRIPTVTIFGATDPARWGPPPVPYHRVLTNPVSCWPCDYWACPVGYHCLEGITVEQVAGAAVRAIELAPSHFIRG